MLKRNGPRKTLAITPPESKTGWHIRTKIIWYNNLCRVRLGDVRFDITTEVCDGPYLSSKTWCVRVNIRRFAEDSSDSLDRIKVKSHIIWDNNLTIGRLGDVRFNITTEGCEEPCLSSKSWCVRVNIGILAEDSSKSLDRTKIRSYIIWD